VSGDTVMMPFDGYADMLLSAFGDAVTIRSVLPKAQDRLWLLVASAEWPFPR
jgi:hypothetical protein